MSDVPPLAQSAFDKLGRAKKHIDELEIGISAWLSSSHRVSTKSFPDVNQACQYIRQVAPLPDGWPSLAGDAIHNLRAALDHLVWGFTLQEQRWQPRGHVLTGCKWLKTGFPVRTNPPPSWQPIGLWGISPGLIERFRAEQPVTTGQRQFDGTLHPLYVLNELWNRDKHRTVFDITQAVRFPSTSPQERFLMAVFGGLASEFPQVRIEAVTHYHRGAIEYGKEVEWLCLRFAQMPNDETLHAYLDKYAKPTVDVLFDEGPPAFGEAVRPLLRRCYDRVEGILNRFVPEFNARLFRIPKRDHRCPP